MHTWHIPQPVIGSHGELCVLIRVHVASLLGFTSIRPAVMYIIPFIGIVSGCKLFPFHLIDSHCLLRWLSRTWKFYQFSHFRSSSE